MARHSVGRVAEGGGPHVGSHQCHMQGMPAGVRALADTKKWRMVTAQGSARQLRPLTPSQTLSTKSQDHRDGAGWEPATNPGIRHTEPQGVDLEAPCQE